MARKLLLVGAAIASLMLAVVVAFTVRHVLSSHPATASPAVNADGTDVSTDVDLMLANYADNEIAADRKYKDHSFRIRALVLAVEREDGHASAVLGSERTSPADGHYIRVTFANDDEAATLHTAEIANLICVGDGVSAHRVRARKCIRSE